MRKRNNKKYMLLLLFVLLSVGLLGGMTLGRYAGEWKHSFGLSISPINNIDYNVKRYFRSNELLPASEKAAYTVNGTSAWFSVSNGLDSTMYSEDSVNYRLTWYASVDGVTWTEFDKVNEKFKGGEYLVEQYDIGPVEISGNICNYIKVCGTTKGSFLQEDIEAVYTFVYSPSNIEISYYSGVITVFVDTNDTPGDFEFTWDSGITPDNSDVTGIFKNASVGPSHLTAELDLNTKYEFLFFVTDEDVLATLHSNPGSAADYVTAEKK